MRRSFIKAFWSVQHLDNFINKCSMDNLSYLVSKQLFNAKPCYLQNRLLQVFPKIFFRFQSQLSDFFQQTCLVLWNCLETFPPIFNFTNSLFIIKTIKIHLQNKQLINRGKLQYLQHFIHLYIHKLKSILMFQIENQKTLPTSDWPCKLLADTYDLQTELGHGTYGSVYKALNKTNERYFALKKMENFDNKNQLGLGFPITTLRQIKLLQKLSHPNILNINQVVYERSGKTQFQRLSKPPVIYLCLDLMEFDLSYLVKEKSYEFSFYRIQIILKQILEAIAYLSKHSVAHRDIKPSNILINKEGLVKIADFGLAKKLSKLSTVKVCTLWYRAPQLLLGLKQYSTNIDVWSVGCIAVEFLIRQPLFKQYLTERDLTLQILKLCGTPDRCDWQEQVSKLQIFKDLNVQFSNQSQIIYYLKKNTSMNDSDSDQLFNLIQKMLRINPHSRLTAAQCLQHNFFKIQFSKMDSQIVPESIVAAKWASNQQSDKLKKRIKL